MKENKMLRLASGLLVCVLMSSSVIGGTFAKYTTEGTLTDTARVAKWGVVIKNESEAFKKEYKKSDTDTAVIVKSTTDEKVVAPGTSGVLLESGITGVPEVAVKVKTEATLALDNWTIEVGNPAQSVTYFPIIFTIDGNEYKMGDMANVANHVYNDFTAFRTAIEGALSTEDNLAPGTDLKTDYSHNVSWKWEFEGKTNPYQTDAKDTALGNVATTANPPKIQLNYTITVTQID